MDSVLEIKKVGAHLSVNPIINWCRLQDLNPPPHDYKSCALPDELSRLLDRILSELF